LEIARLFELKVRELKDRWRAVYGNEPPPRSSKTLLISAIASKDVCHPIHPLAP
jgi:hypothetical protein